MSYPKYRAAGIIVGDDWDALTRTVLNYGGATAVVGFNANLTGRENYFLCTGVADDVQINAGEAYVTALGGGTLEYERGEFVLANPIIPTGNKVWHKGQGPDTLINGDALATNEHAFHVTGREDFKLTDMSIQTENGGTKTCHCILIEDGSDRFHLENITILDSDEDGIRVEGTTITRGVITGCSILGADGYGIFLDPDDGNYFYYIHVTDNYITETGDSGILTNTSTGGFYYGTISDNIIEDVGDAGIELLSTYDATCNSNIIHSSAQAGIRANDSSLLVISDNVCVLAGTNGIYCESDNVTISGNVLTESGEMGASLLDADDLIFSNNNVYKNDRHGVWVQNCLRPTITGNNFNENGHGDVGDYNGIFLLGGTTNGVISNNIIFNNFAHGIHMASVESLVEGNVIFENGWNAISVFVASAMISNNILYDNGQAAAGTYHELELDFRADNSVIKGNLIYSPGDSTEDCIHLQTGAFYVHIEGNYCYNGMGSGITLAENNDYCSIIGNYLKDNDDYGVKIPSSDALRNTVKYNTFTGNGIKPLLNEGTQTRLHNKPFRFTEPIGGTIVTTSPVGVDVDAGGEQALTWGQIPIDVVQVDNIKITAVATAGPIGVGGHMHLEIVFNAGGPNAAYNTFNRSWILADFDSEEADYIADDIIQWIVKDSDVGDELSNMWADDSFELFAIHEVGADPDGETDARFRVAQINYV